MKKNDDETILVETDIFIGTKKRREKRIDVRNKDGFFRSTPPSRLKHALLVLAFLAFKSVDAALTDGRKWDIYVGCFPSNRFSSYGTNGTEGPTVRDGVG